MLPNLKKVGNHCTRPRLLALHLLNSKIVKPVVLIKQWQWQIASANTHQHFCTFVEYLHSPKRPFSEICETRQTRRHSPNCVARTRQIRQHLPKAIYEKNVTRLAKFAPVICESREFGVSSHCLVLTIIAFNVCIVDESPEGRSLILLRVSPKVI